MGSLAYIDKIFENIRETDPHQVESVYHDVKSAGVIIPSGEGRSKGALSIACSEMAKMVHGKIVLDRSDVGFPGRDVGEAAPTLRKRFGQVCLLINSGSGKSLSPLLDAQRLGVYIASSGQARDFRIDLATSVPDSPLGRIGSKYGNTIYLKGRGSEERSGEPREFRTYGIMEDVFILASGLLFHCMADAIAKEAPAQKVISTANGLSSEVTQILDRMIESQFFSFILDALEQRKSCFFAGLGSGQEVARMTAVRVGHVKRAIGDEVYVAGDSNTAAPRAGDILVVISQSGETEVVVGWCRNFIKMGGVVASIVGTSGSTIESLSKVSFGIESDAEAGMPNNFYIKAAFALSPMPIYLVERIEEKGLRLPEYILDWHRSVIS